jgi:hypothetical protein
MMVYPRESKKTDTRFGIDYRGLRKMRKPILILSMGGKEEISSDLLLLLLLPSCRLSIHGNATHSFDCPTADLQST